MFAPQPGGALRCNAHIGTRRRGEALADSLTNRDLEVVVAAIVHDSRGSTPAADER